jgi:hypothetical protein
MLTVEIVAILTPRERQIMAIRMGRRVPNWLILLITAAAIMAAIVASSLLRPLPEYLMAAAVIKPGSEIQVAQVTKVRVDLGAAANSYLPAQELSPGASVTRVVRPGELLARADLGFSSNPNLTALRLTPKLKPAAAVAPGAWVSVWEVVQGEDGAIAQRLVARAEVLDVVYGEGLFSQELPEVELLISTEQSLLLMQAISSKSDLYLLPLP